MLLQYGAFLPPCALRQLKRRFCSELLCIKSHLPKLQCIEVVANAGFAHPDLGQSFLCDAEDGGRL
jgi:hypothetical protein